MPANTTRKLANYLAMLSVTTNFVAPSAFAASLQPGDNNTSTPIKHVIVIYGENRSFDHLYATYQPKNGETVNNLLSQGIVNTDGSPGAELLQGNAIQGHRHDDLPDRPRQNGPVLYAPPVDGGRTAGQQRYGTAIQDARRSRGCNQRSPAARSPPASDRSHWLAIGIG